MPRRITTTLLFMLTRCHYYYIMEKRAVLQNVEPWMAGNCKFYCSPNRTVWHLNWCGVLDGINTHNDQPMPHLTLRFHLQYYNKYCNAPHTTCGLRVVAGCNACEWICNLMCPDSNCKLNCLICWEWMNERMTEFTLPLNDKQISIAMRLIIIVHV